MQALEDFYKLGMAHTFGLPTIIHAKTAERVPVNLRHLNIIKDRCRRLNSVRDVLSKDEYHPVYVA